MIPALVNIPVWSKNSSTLGVSEKPKFFSGDELMEGITGW
jgi:hypothetical protein